MSVRKILLLDSLLIVALLLGFILLRGDTHKPSNDNPATFNKKQYPIDQAGSLWVVVDKGRRLPASYTPSDLVSPNVPLAESGEAENMHITQKAAGALARLVGDAKKQGVSLRLISGYRSYATQQEVYAAYVASDGQAKADTYSARPGYSEHQTGLAADLGASDGKCDLEICFGDTPAGKWLAANAYKYGFIIRYKEDQTDKTGYQYEPWHVRYVGAGLAAQIESSGQTLEEFFGLPNYTDYPATYLQLR